MEKVYDRVSFTSKTSPTGYCPGCGHGTAHKLFASALEHFNLRDKTVLIYPVGCGGLAMPWINVNVIGAAHGRAGAIATAIKRTNPDNFVISYQGDGDLAAIGTAETIHAANRGENITVIFINNANFGMTGGQMAPTTMLGQVATTAQSGRSAEEHGAPLRMAEMIATLDAPKYVARFALHDAKNILKAQQGIMKAVELQVKGEGYSFVELLSMCPTNWKKSPADCAAYMDEAVLKAFPLGVFKDVK